MDFIIRHSSEQKKMVFYEMPSKDFIIKCQRSAFLIIKKTNQTPMEIREINSPVFSPFKASLELTKAESTELLSRPT